MRIILTHVFGWPEVRRGGERLLHELARALDRSGHAVEVLVSTPHPGRWSSLGVPVRGVQARHPFRRRIEAPFGREMAFGGEALIRSLGHGFDAWHALGTADAAAAALRSRIGATRSVYTSLGYPRAASRERRPDRRLHRYVVRHVDGYVCLSDAAGDDLRADYEREPTVIPPGVDVERFAVDDDRHPRPALLFVGDFAETRKNLTMVVEAAGLLVERGLDVEVWVVGDGDRRALAAMRPPNLDADRIVDHGTGPGGADHSGDATLASLYASAWVTVLPAVNEAFGLVLLESLAAGTPIVGLRGGGSRAMLRQGVGVACEPTAASVADACGEAFDLATVSDTREACRAVAWEFDWARAIVPAYEALYGP